MEVTVNSDRDRIKIQREKKMTERNTNILENYYSES